MVVFRDSDEKERSEDGDFWGLQQKGQFREGEFLMRGCGGSW